jgi:hypothetical protein
VKAEVATDYFIEGSGNLSELVSDSSRGKMMTVAEAHISSSHFRVHSGLTDDNTAGSDAQALLSGLNSVNIPTEYGANYNKELAPRYSLWVAS